MRKTVKLINPRAARCQALSHNAKSVALPPKRSLDGSAVRCGVTRQNPLTSLRRLGKLQLFY